MQMHREEHVSCAAAVYYELASLSNDYREFADAESEDSIRAFESIFAPILLGHAADASPEK